MTTPIEEAAKAAEQRGYSRGYAAGRQRVKRELSAEAAARHEAHVWRQLLAAALPAAINASNWQRGGKPVKTGEDRAALAADLADLALKEARRRGRL